MIFFFIFWSLVLWVQEIKLYICVPLKVWVWLWVCNRIVSCLLIASRTVDDWCNYSWDVPSIHCNICSILHMKWNWNLPLPLNVAGWRWTSRVGSTRIHTTRCAYIPTGSPPSHHHPAHTCHRATTTKTCVTIFCLMITLSPMSYAASVYNSNPIYYHVSNVMPIENSI